jgi:hypothetical protein
MRFFERSQSVIRKQEIIVRRAPLAGEADERTAAGVLSG